MVPPAAVLNRTRRVSPLLSFDVLRSQPGRSERRCGHFVEKLTLVVLRACVQATPAGRSTIGPCVHFEVPTAVTQN